MTWVPGLFREALPAHHNGSFWFDSLGEPPDPKPPAALPSRTDVAIVGGGFTGLWTAYYLRRHRPDLDIAVFEAETVGFGASGRNGGWCMGMAMGIDERLKAPDPSAGLALLHAMQDTVDEVGRVCQAENIDCHFAKGGTLTVATTAQQADALGKHVESMHALGFTEDDFRLLPAGEAAARIGMQPQSRRRLHAPLRGDPPGPPRARAGGNPCVASASPCMSAHPCWRSTRGGSRRLGVTCKPPSSCAPPRGYTGSIRGHARRLLPLYSMMVATEPLSDATWSEIGLANRETFGDARRITTYGQRTLDGRLAFGCRVGYRYGSRILRRIESQDPALAGVEATLRALLPAIGDARITHGWGGVLGCAAPWPTLRHVRSRQRTRGGRRLFRRRRGCVQSRWPHSRRPRP